MKDIYTKLLLHMDGTDGSTTFKDETGKTVTAVGNAQIDTAQKKFGTGSALFDGVNDYLTFAPQADFNFNASAFTVDCWVRWASVSYPSGEQCIMAGTTDPSWALRLDANKLKLFLSSDPIYGWNIASNYGTATFVADTWYHIALVWDLSTYKVYVNGVADITITSSTGVYATGLNIGIWCDSTLIDLNGWIDEFRVSKGIARWTANFTPPSSPYNYYIPCGGVAIGSPMIF